MPSESWFEKYENEVYRKIPKPPSADGCRPAYNGTILGCNRAVVRNGRCILHSPKLTLQERDDLVPEEVLQENQFEDSFRSALIAYMSEQKDSRVAHFAGIHFPDVPWSQSPFYDFLRSKANVDFSSAVFHRGANFSGRAFGSGSSFRKAVFRGPVMCGSAGFIDVDFVRAIFEKEVDFNSVGLAGFCNFASARFLDRVNAEWAKVGGRVWFRGGDDHNPVFHGEAIFRRLEFKPDASLSFESVDLSRASFLFTDIERLSFADVQWESANNTGVSRRRSQLFDERMLDSPVVKKDLLEAIAANYRQLVVSCEKRREFDAAEDFHFGEMEVRRFSSALTWPKWLWPLVRNLNMLALYRFVSAYGSSYWRAFLVLILLILTMASLFLVTGLKTNGNLPGVHSIRYRIQVAVNPTTPRVSDVVNDYGVAIVHVLSILTLQRDKPYRADGVASQAFESVASIALAGQTALLLLAIRRKFKR